MGNILFYSAVITDVSLLTVIFIVLPDTCRFLDVWIETEVIAGFLPEIWRRFWAGKFKRPWRANERVNAKSDLFRPPINRGLAFKWAILKDRRLSFKQISIKLTSLASLASDQWHHWQVITGITAHWSLALLVSDHWHHWSVITAKAYKSGLPNKNSLILQFWHQTGSKSPQDA